ncbi:small-molecule methyltransferase IraA [Legionella lansingensis]|uniref:Small-molecule methyltransferase IraA n=1 Tax=Legionella lansingensis TaxID=45067 RepID=A0A0W0VSL4_9GAMM|nr:class I SAM-dependent methyltransferase [Legionella lansingensis]KTD23107.1 small-molecule methyltransferase IraA [Legionella lansingensis]SNV51158.1 small-molecule methyltransferase IraA [Legionella lansingensis]
MQIDNLYDKIARTYNQDVSGKVLDLAKQAALELAISNYDGPMRSILALGMGDGTDLLPYAQHYSQAQLHGLDISERMLEKAKKILKCRTYHGDIHEAASIIEKHDFDFILAHFVTAYIPLPSILAECKKLISQQGVVSIVTNTMESFPQARSLVSKLEKSTNPFNKLVASHIKKTLKKVYVPLDGNHLQKIVEDNGFKIKAFTQKKISISLKTENEIFDFFINGGWFISGLVHPFLAHQLLCRICKLLIHKNFSVPYDDHMVITIALVEPS